VIQSGSRASIIGLAAVVAIFPFIERTTRAAYYVAFGCSIVLGIVSQVPLHASENSAVGRLLGGGSASGSDIERTRGLQHGFDLFWAHPVSGNGLIPDQLFHIHNDLLEVAVATGIVGFVAYLGVLFAFGRVLFLRTPEHYLGYTVVAFFVIAATEPSLWDRSTWCAMALAFQAHGIRRRGLLTQPAAPAEETPAARRPSAHPPRIPTR
jgi:O-antigen ligase